MNIRKKKDKKKDISLIFRQYFERELDRAVELKK